MACVASALPQFTVFNRQLFPSFAGFGGRRPQPDPRPTRFQSFNRPQSQRFVPQPQRIVSQPRPVTTVRQPSPVTTFKSAPNTLFREAMTKNLTKPHEVSSGSSSSSANCNPSVTNVEYNGQHYYVQWKNRATAKYTWNQARSSCSGLGMKMISMDNPAKRDHFLNMLERDHYDYFWAGAKIQGYNIYIYIY